MAELVNRATLLVQAQACLAALQPEGAGETQPLLTLAIALESTEAAGIALEIHKQLRLLALDRQFLVRQRDPQRRAERVAQIQGRLTLLGRYCEAVADSLTP